MSGIGVDQLSDAELISLSLAEPQSFTAIFDRHALSVRRYVAARVPPSDVEDLVSETFITAFRSRGRYDQSYADAWPWLLGIATNILRHHRRAEGRRRTRLRALEREPWTDPTDPADQVMTDLAFGSQTERMSRALARLDQRYRNVLLLVARPGLTYEEAARALDIPIGTVRSRLLRGRAQLRELLGLSGQYGQGAGAPTPSATEGLLE